MRKLIAYTIIFLSLLLTPKINYGQKGVYAPLITKTVTFVSQNSGKADAISLYAYNHFLEDETYHLSTDGSTSNISNIDVMYPMDFGTKALSLVNLITPGSYTMTQVNSPMDTLYHGWSSNGTTSYLNNNWNPSTNGVNYTLNSNCAGVYTPYVHGGGSGSANFVFGNSDATNYILLSCDYSAVYSMVWQSCQTTSYQGVAVANLPANSNGMYSDIRSSATNASTSVAGWYNGASKTFALVGTTYASTAIPNKTMYTLCINYNGSVLDFSVATISFEFFGSKYVDQKQLYYDYLYDVAWKLRGTGL